MSASTSHHVSGWRSSSRPASMQLPAKSELEPHGESVHQLPLLNATPRAGTFAEINLSTPRRVVRLPRYCTREPQPRRANARSRFPCHRRATTCKHPHRRGRTSPSASAHLSASRGSCCAHRRELREARYRRAPLATAAHSPRILRTGRSLRFVATPAGAPAPAPRPRNGRPDWTRRSSRPPNLRKRRSWSSAPSPPARRDQLGHYRAQRP